MGGRRDGAGSPASSAVEPGAPGGYGWGEAALVSGLNPVAAGAARPLSERPRGSFQKADSRGPEGWPGDISLHHCPSACQHPKWLALHPGPPLSGTAKLPDRTPGQGTLGRGQGGQPGKQWW